MRESPPAAGRLASFLHFESVPLTRCLRQQVLLKSDRYSNHFQTTPEALDIVAEFESDETPTVVIAVAGRSNGLGPVVAGNSVLPVSCLSTI